MNHKASIYSNPVIPCTLYHCKLLDLHLDLHPAPDISDKPFLWTSFMTSPFYGEYSGVKLNAILYLTEKSADMLTKFKLTFKIVGPDDLDTYGEAMGRWGCVGVYQNQYNGTEYSSVNFVRQTRPMQITSLSYEKREQLGEQGWLDGGGAGF